MKIGIALPQSEIPADPIAVRDFVRGAEVDLVSGGRFRLGVVYDFRNPPDSDIDTPKLYAEILDQVIWLEQLGLDLVWFTGFCRKY